MGSFDRRALVAVTTFLFTIAVTTAAGATNTCMECHLTSEDARIKAPAMQFRGSVHHDDNIGCIACHGGDAEDPTVRAPAPSAGFVGHPTRDKISQLCGGCHNDARFERRFNALLPVDQLVLFAMSPHGQLAAKGNKAAPVCTTCHGTHNVLRASDPRAPVNSHRVSKLCGKCHSDPKHMAGRKLPTDQLSKWERSAHAAALKKGVPNAPSCVGCHGSHGEMQGTVASVGRACGSCHTEQLANFRKSPHAKPYRRLGFTECVPCHGNHDVPVVQPLLLGVSGDGACGKCHSKKDKKNAKPQKVIDELAAKWGEVSERAARAKAAAERGKTMGLYIPAIAFALTKLQTAEQQVRPTLHSFDPNLLKRPFAAITDAAAEVERLVHHAEKVQTRQRSADFVAIALVLLLLLLLVVKSVRATRGRTG